METQNQSLTQHHTAICSLVSIKGKTWTSDPYTDVTWWPLMMWGHGAFSTLMKGSLLINRKLLWAEALVSWWQRPPLSRAHRARWTAWWDECESSQSPHLNPAENLFMSFSTDALDLQHYPQNIKSWEMHYNAPTHYTYRRPVPWSSWCTVIQLISMPDGVWRLLNTFLCCFKWSACL